MAKRSSGRPWTKWYWADWRAETGLRMCSLAAKGLWAEMLSLMDDSDVFGHLTANGQAMTDAQLGVAAGASAEQVAELIRELESAGVFSRTRKGVIFCRRMVRDEAMFKISQKNGKKGGNPTISKQREKLTGVNPPLNHPLKPICQKQDTREEEKEVSNETSQKKKPDTREGAAPDKRGTRLPGDWRPSQAEIGFAAELGIPPPQIPEIAAVFRDYWIGKPGRDGVKLDWPATWRNWCRKEAQKYGNGSHINGFQGGGGGNPHRGGGKPQPVSQLAVYAGVAARLADDERLHADRLDDQARREPGDGTLL